MTKENEVKLAELIKKRDTLKIESRWLLKGGSSNVKEILRKLDEEIKSLQKAGVTCRGNGG